MILYTCEYAMVLHLIIIIIFLCLNANSYSSSSNFIALTSFFLPFLMISFHSLIYEIDNNKQMRIAMLLLLFCLKTSSTILLFQRSEHFFFVLFCVCLKDFHFAAAAVNWACGSSCCCDRDVDCCCFKKEVFLV